MSQLVIDSEGRVAIESFYNPYPKQLQLHTSDSIYILGIGGNGSGKSAFLLGEAINVCHEFPGSDVLLLRRDYPELEKGLILDFKSMVPKELYHYNDQKHIVTFKVNGVNSHIFFGHLQNQSEKTLSQYLSAAFVFIGIDELGQFSYNAWSFLSSRNRVNRECQRNAQGYWPTCRMGGATNPLGPGFGWIKKLWVDKQPVSQLGQVSRGTNGKYYQESNGKTLCVYDPKEYFYVHSTVLDNPAQLEKDPLYIEKLEKLPPALRKKALYGDLNAVAGSYFSNFSRDRNVLSLPKDHDRIKFDPWQPVWIGFDWGLAHHTAVYWNTRAQVQGIDDVWRSCVVTKREMVVNESDYQNERELGKHADDWNYKQYICNKIKQLTPQAELEQLKFIFLSPERFNRIDETAHTVAGELSAIFRKLGLPMCSEANDARMDGAVMMYNLIDSGEWVILDNCPIIISAIETRVRDEKNLEDVMKTEDELDDAYDGCRYGLLSMLKEKGKPAEIKLAEKLSTIQDHTSRMIYAYQHRLKEQEKGKPVKARIVPRWMKQ